MGNKVSLNVGCCRRGHLIKLKIDTSDELEDTSLNDTTAENSLGTTKSKSESSGVSNGIK